MATGPNRINPTPVRMTTDATTERVTPKTNFGDRVQQNLASVGGAVAAGVGVAASYIPGGAILSAALSGATTFASAQSSGQAPSGARVGAYYMAGVAGPGASVPVPGSTGGSVPTGGSIGGTAPSGGMQIPGAGGMPNPMDVLQAQAASNMQFLVLQNQMQQENQRFSTLSNVMKTRHDTASNTIRNMH